MKGRSITYSDAELVWIKTNSARQRPDAHQEFCQRFDRSDVSLSNYASLCKRNGWLTGRTGQFVAGMTPANKGKTMPFHPNNARTRFKRGNLPHNTKHLGHERVSKDGYVEISIDETNPHTGFGRRYVLKHRHLWEKQNGPVPVGHALKCLDGDKKNCEPENWTLIPRAILPRLSGRFGRGYETAAPELKPAIMAIAKLEHKARTRSRKKQKGEV